VVVVSVVSCFFWDGLVYVLVFMVVRMCRVFCVGRSYFLGGRFILGVIFLRAGSLVEVGVFLGGCVGVNKRVWKWFF